jgi:hypothetical protein
MPSVEEFRRGLDSDTLAFVDALRKIVAGANTKLTEGIKWNAPSFALAGEDRITLGIERKGGVRVVFHRGAKVKDAAKFKFEDTAGLAQWPARDRGVVVFKTLAEVEAKRKVLGDLCKRWLGATT